MHKTGKEKRNDFRNRYQMHLAEGGIIMKKRLTALSLAALMVMGTVAMAAGVEKTISVTPMDMTLNDKAVTPTKSNGTPAEVFSYDGITYVPLRYLSELLGIQVEWDKTDPGTANW